ncbi:MAG TPA: TetR/AcrR family transcriptional regulator [Vicinamibacterales bacterium]
MGVKERQEREREAVSRSILDAARELFVTHGYQEVSIRKIADRIEYSPAAIYSYFPSKDDIFFALAEEGFRLLFSYAHDVNTTAADDPADTLRQMFWRYYQFSKDHPEYFALMFLDRSVPKIRDNWERFGFIGQLKDDTRARIGQAMAAGAVPDGTSAHAVFRLLLTAAHGVAALRLCDRLAPGEDADALARATIDAVIIGLKGGAGRSLPDPPSTLCNDPLPSVSEDSRHES